MPITLLCLIYEWAAGARNTLFDPSVYPRESVYKKRGCDATPLFPQTRYFYRRDEEPL